MKQSPSFSGKLTAIVLLFFSCALSVNKTVYAGNPIYTVGVLNQQSVEATAELWNPLLLYLGRKTGSRFVLAIGSTVQKTDASTARGQYDLVYSNHIFNMPIQRKYRPILRWGGQPLSGVLVSLKPWRLEDLNGKTIAFPSREAFAATVLTWTRLQREHIRFRPLFTGSQQACLAALAKGLADAASVTPRFATPYARRHHLQLRTLYQSDDFPQIPLLVHRTRVPNGLAERIRSVLLDMPRDREGRRLLATLGIPPFQPADDALYNRTRKVYAQWHRLGIGAKPQLDYP